MVRQPNRVRILTTYFRDVNGVFRAIPGVKTMAIDGVPVKVYTQTQPQEEITVPKPADS